MGKGAWAAAALFLLGACQSEPIDREALKEELRRELIAELRAELRREEAPAAEIPRPAPRARPAGPTGTLRGQMLRDGRPLPRCRVKAVELLRLGPMEAFFGDWQEGREYVTVTDGDGIFRLRLPPGRYKLKWQPPGERGWIRRLRNRPDATVRAGEETELPPIETHRPLIPH